MNENISKNTVLFWDEPEANINPKLVPVIVDVILELSRQGVQIFLATHDYIFAKYLEVKMNETDAVKFHSLYKTDDGVKCETRDNFRDMTQNPLISSFDTLIDEAIGRNMGD
jgi:ABC-type polar amino acid transport system ATPase subunit